MSITEILESALDLSLTERAKIASVLIESLDSNQGVYDQQMVDEVERRELEVEQGKSKYLSEEEFLSGIIRNRQ
jgi:putative addiction module component (TIGR02574 family)